MNTVIPFLRRNAITLLSLAAVLSAAITFYVITTSDSALGLKPKRVYNLLILNVALLGLIAALIFWRLQRLWTALKQGSAGSKLQTRIILLFAVVSIFPTIAMAVFSALFINVGVQTWFNDRVQTAVEESLAVAQAYLDEHIENLRGDAIAMANDLSNVSTIAISNPQEFDRIVATQTTLRLLTESIVIQRNRIIAQGRLSFALAFENISPDEIERMDRGEVILITGEDDKIRAMKAISGMPDTYLIIGRLVDSKVIDHMDTAKGAVTEYRSLQSQLSKLQLAFLVVFVSLALLLLLTAIWYGIIFAGKLTTPISNLMHMAERVRGGDYSARINNISNDEMGSLSRTFNRMTEQLEQQRSELIQANRQLDERRRFSEAVLSGVSAGVIALNADKRITLINRSSAAILNKIDVTLSTESNIAELLPSINELLIQAAALKGEVAQSSISLTNAGKNITLHVRVVAEMRDNVLEGYIATFDDITLLVDAQRNAAWADVARRVAHEIKNPLTPIQLSAERLKKKYTKYIGDDEENYVRYVDTISKNVGDIGRMVEEFVSFARMPNARMLNEDFAAIIKKSIFSSQVGFPNIHIDLQLPDQPVMLECDERQITQVLTNLIKNAAEAIEASGKQEGGEIKVSLTQEKSSIVLTIRDNGTGFPAGEEGHMLEPYVTTRSKGTGLGLAIVKKIIDDHKGLLKLENNDDCGAKVTLSFSQHCDINAA